MPTVSVIVPCYNEEATIGFLLEALYQQTFPKEDMEVIIADGISSDHTRDKVVEFLNAYPKLKVIMVDNPKRIIPAALNCAITAAQGLFIVRLDAHSMPSPDYVERCVNELAAGRAENVGGIWKIEPGKDHWMAKSISLAASHPLGVGDALYRYTREAQYVDTVPFGSFRRALFDQIGLFDETLLTNEDYEFNTRIRKSGGKIWLDPKIQSVYFSRSTLRDLGRQYFRYGYWKWHMLRRYPDTLRWRQALPPAFVLGTMGLLLLAPVFQSSLILLGIVLLVYLSILVIASWAIANRERDFRLLAGIPMAIVTMHYSWGAGFLWGMIKFLFQDAILSRHES